MYGADVLAAPSIEAFDLGPFRLEALVATGGMGAIWRGVHRTGQTPVAIKVMVADELQGAAFQRAFRNEAWAMASLDHRGIVMVFDQGVVSAEEEEASGGRLHAGAPYIVMDLVDGGTLADRPARDWWDLKATLLLLLDALAHAHARGVIHRDLKPANILVDPDPNHSGGLQLTDFGIAHAIERELAVGDENAAPVMGTLHYMAPEQLDGRWRDYGPWTDLYSLGCIAWELATGALPFDADDPLDLMDMHLEEEPPPFEPRVPVPDGFEQWVRELLAKEPFERPLLAADAAQNLKALGEPDDEERTRALGLTMVQGLPAVRQEQVDARLDGPAGERHDAVQPPRGARFDLGLETLSSIAPVRPTAADDSAARHGIRLQLSWRRQRRRRPWRTLAGAGLGLWGMRTIPLVGRDEELDVIWDALRQVHEEGRARAVLLEGGLGTGSTRVAQWLCQRAHELGVADTVWATHSPLARPSDGLGRLLSREFRCVGLSPSMRQARIADVLQRRGLASAGGAGELAEGLSRWIDADRPRIDGSSTTALDEGERPRFRWIYELLRRAAQRRPVVLWLDDAQWGLEGLAFADYVLRAQDRQPAEVLVIVSVQEDALENGSTGDVLLERLLADRRSAHVPLQPLDRATHLTLVRDLLGLDGNLARRVTESTAGNPLFATQLVGEWIRRGVLVAGPNGFLLSEGGEADIPRDLPALWMNRVHGAVGDMGPAAIRILELAAALGGRVMRVEFAAITQRLGLQAPPGLLDRLYREQLAVPSRGGWSFVHDALRAALEKKARAEGRWSGYQQAVRELAGDGPTRGATTTPNSVVR